MNYYEIGQRIRRYRKAHGMSQDELAEKVGISVTHMSHIETGNTKLSLPVLVALSESLEVRADDLLFSNTAASSNTVAEQISSVLEDCSAAQARVILDIVKASKISIKKHL